MAIMTNPKRGIAANMALQAHARAKGEHFNPTVPLDENVVDLLADLQHLCEQKGIVFTDALRIATSHYETERAEAA